MIRYNNDPSQLTAEQLSGLFVDWPNPPSPASHLRLLAGSDYVVLAIDYERDSVIGFITAISDGVLSAYIPLLETLPEYQDHGEGSELVRRMLEQLRHLYLFD